MLRRSLPGAVAAIAPCMATPANFQDCDRSCLLGFAEQYAQALGAREPKRLPVTADLKFTENLVPLRLGEGLWATCAIWNAQPLRHERSLERKIAGAEE